MEGYYEGRQGAGLVAFGLLNPAKQTPQDGVDPFLFRVEIPKMLSLLAERKMDAFVPGINDLLKGGYPLRDGTVALSAEEKNRKKEKRPSVRLPPIVQPRLRAMRRMQRWLPKC